MQIIADLHLHSRFSRAVSPAMTIPAIYDWAEKKGIELVATGDWTHPMWMREIEKELEEDGSGILRIKNPQLRKNEGENEPRFLLSTELSCIFSQNGKTRRVHTLVWVPTFASAQKISRELTKRGCNLLSDGRPILGLNLHDLAELVFTAEEKSLIVPAHIWTPWFSVYGKMGGFETLEEAFGEFADRIYAVETGLSSSPDMNWRISELDSRSIVSFSDAHSGAKLGREATVFELPELTYGNIEKALKNVQIVSDGLRDKRKEDKNTVALQSETRTSVLPSIAYTIEFYPEEGKYHYTGHRDCHVRLTPEEAAAKGTTCSVCGKPLTQGVMQRIEQLAARGQHSESSVQSGIKLIYSKEQRYRPPFIMLVPLQEIIAEAINKPVTSPKTKLWYDTLTSHFNGEFNVLLHSNLDDVKKLTTAHIADAVRKVRMGEIVIDPGYDGVFGVVKIWKSEEEKGLVDTSKEQLSLL